jgi:hypothetical protein
MAALTLTQCVLLWSDGQSERIALYALKNVTTADTVDLSTLGFSVVKQAIMMGATVIGSAVASFSGNVVTMPAGLNKDAAFLLVWGVAA